MISTKGRYAIRIMLELAENGNDGPFPLKEIAERQEISKKYLEIIAKELVNGGFIKGSSGKNGGYRLVKKPEDVKIGEILEWMEGTLSPVACLSCEDYECSRKETCQTLPMWQEYYQLTRDFFYGKTLKDLLRK